MSAGQHLQFFPDELALFLQANLAGFQQQHVGPLGIQPHPAAAFLQQSQHLVHGNVRYTGEFQSHHTAPFPQGGDAETAADDFDFRQGQEAGNLLRDGAKAVLQLGVNPLQGIPLRDRSNLLVYLHLCLGIGDVGLRDEAGVLQLHQHLVLSLEILVGTLSVSVSMWRHRKET